MDENKEEKSTQYTGEYGNSVEGNYQEEGSSVYSYSYNNKNSETTHSGDYYESKNTADSQSTQSAAGNEQAGYQKSGYNQSNNGQTGYQQGGYNQSNNGQTGYQQAVITRAVTDRQVISRVVITRVATGRQAISRMGMIQMETDQLPAGNYYGRAISRTTKIRKNQRKIESQERKSRLLLEKKSVLLRQQLFCLV